MIKGDLEWFEKVYLLKQSTADLYALFQFICIDYNKQFGGRKDTRDLVTSRYKAVLGELNKRAYDGDPYAGTTIKIEGDAPETIDLSKFDEE